MRFDIVKTDYIKDLVGFKPYYNLIMVAGGLTLLMSRLNLEFLPKNDVVTAVALVVVVVFFILYMLNTVLFTRIGTLQFNSDQVIASTASGNSPYTLEEIKKVKIDKVQSKQYEIHLNTYINYRVEMTADQVEQLEDFLKQNQIEVEVHSVMHWLRRRL